MARRRLFPALRDAIEGKSLSITGGFGSISLPRVHTFGLRDAAAGWDIDTVVQEGYERSIWVYKAVEVIAGNQSRLPFVIRDGDDEVENHPLLRVMNKRANPLETGRQFRKRLSMQILMSKRGAFVEVTKSRGGKIVRLDLLDPSRVRIVPDMSGEYISYFEYTRPDGLLRPLAVEDVRWIREPHPLDPYSGTSPIDPAGMSIELDRLSRTYNVSFIKRDGRPGGVIGVDTDDLDPAELTRIAGLFAPGADHAGQIHAIGTGKGGLNYIDTSARPRDMAYSETSTSSKKEILAAFGVPESMAGDSSERTFDNAEQEEFNFWHDPMLPHLDLIAAAFDGDVDDDLDCGFDTSSVEALELPARRRRAEHRDEVEGGLRTIKEYRDGAKLDLIDTPQTRALWISPAKSPIPGVDTDAAALGLEDPNAAGGINPMAPGGPPAPGEPQTAADVVAQAIAEGGVVGPAEAAPEGEAAAAVAAARQDGVEQGDEGPGEAAEAVDAARMEGKSLDVTAYADTPPHTYDPGDEDAHRAELAIATTLEALMNRQAAIITARLESPKTRRGTPYWVPVSDDDTRAGDAPIDSARVVDTARWLAEAQESLRPTLSAASTESALGVLEAMAAAGALVAPSALVAQVAGRAAPTVAAGSEQVARAAAMAGMKATLLALATAQLAIEDWLQERIADIDQIITEQATPDLTTVTTEVRRLWETKSRPFARSLAVSVAQTAVIGAREQAVEALGPQSVTATSYGTDSYTVVVEPEVTRTWSTRHDEQVRAAHRAADGQTVGVGEYFHVGGHDLRWPSDPLAPPEVSRNCRCWIAYTWSDGATFTVVRNDAIEAAAA